MNAQPQVHEPDRIASATDVATYFRQDCRALRDSLQLEMVVAQYLVRMRDVRSPEGVPVGDALSAGLIAEIERQRDPLSHAMLRALAHLGSGETARRSAEAGGRLAERGVGLPVKFADVAGARAVGAWRASAGGRGSEYALFVEFEYSLGTRHSLALFVRGGVAKHIALMNPMGDLDPDEPFHPSAMETVELAAAGVLLREVLDRSFRAGSDDYRVLIAAARARSMG
ncbi:MAG: hypothetical protein QOI80_3407 [Solirubrobacteraceae bacterium]|nr:hypothetical protein [Solirubrobacteraceae bacterium]